MQLPFLKGWLVYLFKRHREGMDLEPLSRSIFLEEARKYRILVQKRGIPRLAPFSGVIVVTHWANLVPGEGKQCVRVGDQAQYEAVAAKAPHRQWSALYADVGVKSSPRDVQDLVSIRQRVALRGTMEGATVVSIALLGKRPPKDFVDALQHWGPCLAWISADDGQDAVKHIASMVCDGEKPGTLLKKGLQNEKQIRLLSTAAQWVQSLCAVVPEKHRFLDRCTTAFCAFGLKESPDQMQANVQAQRIQDDEWDVQQRMDRVVDVLDAHRALPVRTELTYVLAPSIPGTGKSRLLDPKTVRALEEQTGCQVMGFDGDDPKYAGVRFWKEVKIQAWSLPPFEKKYMFIIAKNVPPGLSGGMVGSFSLHNEIVSSAPAGSLFVFFVPRMHKACAKWCEKNENPYCLCTLAHCIARVNARQEHPSLQGRGSAKTVALFHNLYNGIPPATWSHRLNGEGGVRPWAAAEFDLLHPDAPTLPAELGVCLERGKALRAVAQKELVVAKSKMKGRGEPRMQRETEDKLLAWEEEVGGLLEEHRPTLEKQAVELSAFREQAVDVVVRGVNKARERASAHTQLAVTSAPPVFLGLFLDDDMPLKDAAFAVLEKEQVQEGFTMVNSLHVTLWHKEDKIEMPEILASAVGEQVEITCDAILLRKDRSLGCARVVQVRAVDEPTEGVCGFVREMQGRFLHITLFTGAGVKPVESQRMSEEVEEGTAEVIVLGKKLQMLTTVKAVCG